MRLNSKHLLFVLALCHAPLFAQQPQMPGRAPEPEMAQALVAMRGFIRQVAHDTLNPQIALLRDNLLRIQLEPQLREFLKDQMYCMALSVDSGALYRRDMDLGPVDYAVLKDANSCARGEWKGKTYELVVEKHALTRAGVR